MEKTLSARVRGAVVLGQLKYVEARYGEGVLERARARLDDVDRTDLELMVSVSWLPVGSVERFKRAIADELGRDHDSLQREVVRAAMDDMLHTVWRVLLKSLWDSALIKRAPILYSKTFDRGNLRVERMGGGRAFLVLSGWPDMGDYDLLGLCTGIESVLEFAGRRDARLQWSRSGLEIHLQAAWSATS